jgi:hypothetical protein
VRQPISEHVLRIASRLFPPRIDGGDVFVPPPASLGVPVDGRERFAVTFASPSEAAAIKGKTLRLTLVSDQGSTETMWKAE